MSCPKCKDSETPFCPQCGAERIVPKDVKLARVLEDHSYVEDVDWLTIAGELVAEYSDEELVTYVSVMKFIDRELQ